MIGMVRVSTRAMLAYLSDRFPWTIERGPMMHVAIMEALIASPREMSQDEIFDVVYRSCGSKAPETSDSIRVHILRMRRAGWPIETVRGGRGYRLRKDEP